MPEKLPAADAQSACKCGAQGEYAKQRRYADQAIFKDLVIVEEPVAHAAEDGEARI